MTSDRTPRTRPVALLAVLVLHVLTTRMRAVFGHTDIDDLRELHD